MNNKPATASCAELILFHRLSAEMESVSRVVILFAFHKMTDA
jgi:hypothetical protein